MRAFLRSLTLAAALFVSFGLGAAVAAGIPIAKKSITVKTAAIDISVQYPQTGNKAIDAVLLAYARKQAELFKGYAKDWEKGQPGYYLDIGYSVERNDGQMLGIVFSENNFTGGAHPNNFTTTFNFLMPDGAQVFLPEILAGPNGIDRVSRLAIAKLIKDIGSGPEPASDPDTIKMGAGPSADNFKAFIWLPSKLHIYFPSYQVASYAAGPQETTLPLQALKDVIRTDWRAPAPSFDCNKAATSIEHAICADAALARLDRQVAETYAVNLRNAYDPAPQATLRQQQRDWLAKRNKTCGGPAPGACLIKLYTARLAVLSAPTQ